MFRAAESRPVLALPLPGLPPHLPLPRPGTQELLWAELHPHPHWGPNSAPRVCTQSICTVLQCIRLWRYHSKVESVDKRHSLCRLRPRRSQL